jgi:hypothetical protein
MQQARVQKSVRKPGHPVPEDHRTPSGRQLPY